MFSKIFRSQMISQEDYDVIVGVEQPGQMRDKLLTSHRYQVARTFMNLLGHISKDQTIQYILTLVDDILSVSFGGVGSYSWD